jgi:hypothetical protein
MNRYYKVQGSCEKCLGGWRRIFRVFIRFDPFAVAQNVGITNLSGAEKVGQVFFKFINFILATPDYEVPKQQ